MKRKILSVILAAGMLASLASCTDGEENSTTGNTPAPTETTTTTAPEAEPDPQPTEDPEGGEAPDAAAKTDCQKLTDEVLAVDSLAEVATMAVEDESMLSDVMNYDLSLFSEYSVVTHLMSAHLIEIVVAKPAEGKESDALAMLEKRKDQLINEVAFYPEQQENAEKTVYGSLNDNEYVYLLCGSDPAEMEEALKAALSE